MRVIRAIGKVTFQEMLRDKILYNIVLFAILLLGLGFLVSRLSFIQPDRVILDFGLTAINLACSMVAIFAGASLLGRELERRTAHVALARPISREQFVLGKFFGLGCILAVNWALLCFSYLAVLWLASEGLNFLGFTFFFALVLILIQSLLLSSLSILFSTISTTSLSVVLTIGCYLVGNNISQFRFIATKLDSEAGKYLLNLFSYLLPNLEYFNLGPRATYGLPIGLDYGVLSLGYGFCFTLLVLVIAGYLFRMRKL